MDDDLNGCGMQILVFIFAVVIVMSIFFGNRLAGQGGNTYGGTYNSYETACAHNEIRKIYKSGWYICNDCGARFSYRDLP